MKSGSRSPDLNHGETAFLEELLDDDLRVVAEHFFGRENHLRIFDESQDSPQVWLVLDVPADRMPRHSASEGEGEILYTIKVRSDYIPVQFYLQSWSGI